MISVMINGSESSLPTGGLQRISDIVELIKASIDPDHMITGILLDGRDLEETDWQANTTQFGTAILEVETGTPVEFVSVRLAQAAEVVRSCFLSFRDARKSFQDGQMVDGNQKLISAANMSEAFFEWYATLLELVPAEEKATYDISPQVKQISEVCKRICQQQLYQSWWALGETIEKELEPKFDKLEDFCRKFRPS